MAIIQRCPVTQISNSEISLHYGYIMVVLWLHYGYIRVILWLPYGCIVVKLWLHCGYNMVTLRLHYGYVMVTDDLNSACQDSDMQCPGWSDLCGQQHAVRERCPLTCRLCALDFWQYRYLFK